MGTGNLSLGFLLLHWIVSALALFLTGKLVPGFQIRNYGSALVATLMISVANVLIRPILIFLTLPLTIVTLGLFIFVVDAIVLRICAGLLKNFDINSWLSAILGAFVLAVFSAALNFLLF